MSTLELREGLLTNTEAEAPKEVYEVRGLLTGVSDLKD